MKKIMFLFAAGCLGGLVMSLVAWQFGVLGLSASVGAAIEPTMSPAWLYPRIVWGGIGGILFVIPFLKSKVFLKALVLIAVLTVVQFFVAIPLDTYRGLSTANMGLFTFLFVLLFNSVWGFVTALSIKYAR